MHIRNLLFLLFACLCYQKASAQSTGSCAESHMRAVQRQAAATPEHQRLMNQYNMTFYKLDLQLERNSTYIAGNVTLAAEVRDSPLTVFAFELHPNFQIDSVLVNGTRETVISRNAGDVAVELSSSVNTGAPVSAIIYYKGTAPTGAGAAIGNGFSTATDPNWGNSVTWSLSQPYAAYEWWPTKQVLTDKADSVHVFVTTSAENKVGSNGLLTRVADVPNNRRRFEWKSHYPIAYYLVSVAVSDYAEYLISANPEGAAASVPILNYVYSGGALDFYREEIDRTAPFLEYFSELFTLYPFHEEKYGHSMAPMGGGMEHQTMTTQSTFTFTLTAHELAHQWFGDHVTCATWQDIWLNEGFASYAEYLALQRYSPTDAGTWMQQAHAFALQRPSGSLRVRDTTSVSRIFDYRLTYKKAAAVVHMLRFEVDNDALFFEALRNYMRQYGGGTAYTADLQRVFEETTNMDLNYFFDQWYNGEGYPIFNVEWNQEGNRLLIVNRQTTSSTSTPFFRTDLQYLIRTATGTTTVRVTQDEPLEQHLLEVEGTITAVEVDPQNWVLNTALPAQQNPALEVPALEEVVLYPNPTPSSIQIDNLSFGPTAAIIYNTAGQIVKRLPLKETMRVTMDVSDLSAGYYILQLSNNRQHYRARFIKVGGR
ncbi:T9SS C-terminal target domain-containing protein [Pontibacter diazotrophicus]|uniref:Aminopeptidase N n=1 Tax=Pontibacter diazotrophicus TaxID=1400979 RepID=A0A3D8LFE4_9BACT|nr:M1 family aminopeptidase [Pontibacter diazotrophicus]RDV15642.1 T9SS C-terminal target domain-containing protein [Pontibacter diazotrophicus]